MVGANYPNLRACNNSFSLCFKDQARIDKIDLVVIVDIDTE